MLVHTTKTADNNTTRTPNSSLCHSLASAQQQHKNDVFALFLVFFATDICCFANTHSMMTPIRYRTKPSCVARELPPPPLEARSRVCTEARALLIDTRPQPPAYERVPTQPKPFYSKLSAMESTDIVKPRSWPPSGTHPPAPWRGGAVSNRSPQGFLLLLRIPLFSFYLHVT